MSANNRGGVAAATEGQSVSVPVADKLGWNVGEVCAMTGLGERTVYRMVNESAFPFPRKVGGRNVWIPDEVRAWVVAQPAAKP